MVKQIFIENRNFENFTSLLDSRDGEKTVVGYIRCAADATTPSYSMEAQQNVIMSTLQRQFGDNFRVIWIPEIGSGKGQFKDGERPNYLPGLGLVSKLIKTRTAQHVAVADQSRISRNAITYIEFTNLLSEHRATLITPATEEAELLGNFSNTGSKQTDQIMGLFLNNMNTSTIVETLNGPQENGSEDND